jgi:hypothetical protein
MNECLYAFIHVQDVNLPHQCNAIDGLRSSCLDIYDVYKHGHVLYTNIALNM